MRIPKTLKIGGKIYTVELTDKMFLGRANVSAEIFYEDLVIRICQNPRARMEADFVHEMLHAVASHLGYYKQDESKIEALAAALYAVFVDNPELFRTEVTDNEKAVGSAE